MKPVQYSANANILLRTKKFAIQIIKAAAKFPRNSTSFILTDQLIRSSSSIGANLMEAQEAVSKNEFVYKLKISLKEAKESLYWLDIIYESDVYRTEELKELIQENEEITRILVTIVKNSKSKIFIRNS